MNGPETSGTVSLETASPAHQSRSVTSTAATAAGDWLCGWCLNLVANERARFCYEGKHEFTFSNPEGMRFEIMTFSETEGCRQEGVPTLAHTWFEGHAW